MPRLNLDPGNPEHREILARLSGADADIAAALEQADYRAGVEAAREHLTGPIGRTSPPEVYRAMIAKYRAALAALDDKTHRGE